MSRTPTPQTTVRLHISTEYRTKLLIEFLMVTKFHSKACASTAYIPADKKVSTNLDEISARDQLSKHYFRGKVQVY